jgi:hypothetical protein
LINGALVSGSLAISLLLAELVLRAIGFSYPVWWTYDDITGSKLFAGAEGWQRVEGEAFIRINRDGQRDREHSRTKPPNTVRFAILGDSMTEALNVPLESTFWSVLERELKSCKAFGNRDVEIVNFGVSGYGTAQQLLTFRHRAAAYSPDVTVLAFYAGNDVRNNSKELEPVKLRPFFNIHNDSLVLDNSFLTDHEYLSLKSNFDKRKMFFDLRTFQLIRKLKALSEQWHAGRAGAARGTTIEPGLDDNVFLVPTATAWKQAWQITERLIVATRDEVVAGGGRFLVASIPIGIQAHPDPEVRGRFMRTLHIDDFWYPENRMRELATREKVETITLGRTFQAYAEANQTYLYGFRNTRLGTGHLNENGHKLIGESIAKHFCQSK